MKKTALFLCFFGVFIAGLWVIAIPRDLIISSIKDSIENDRIYLEIKGFKKGLFYNASADEVLVRTDHPGITGGLLLKLDDVSARLNFFSLLKLNPYLDIDCRLNGGQVKGVAMLTGTDRLKMKGQNVQLSGIPLLESTGLHADGTLSLSINVNDGTGDVSFSSEDIRLANTPFSSLILPLDIFSRARGVLTINRGIINIKSFSLEGKGIYARIKGSATEKTVNMKMELMTDSSFKAGKLMNIMLERYKVSPGYYVIPINTAI